MKTTKFKSIVIKVKNNGTSFIQIPKHFANKFSIKEEIKVTINNNINFFCNIRLWKGLGFYVPAKVAMKNELFGKEANVIVQKIDGFHAKVLYDGRVYISNHVSEENRLAQSDIILLECKSNDRILREYCRIHCRQKKNTAEYFCMFTRKRSQAIEGVFKILKVFHYQKIKILNKKLKELSNFDNFVEISNKSIIIFHGNRVPLIINSQIRLEDFSYYLGCYFADGTKKGSSWGICASTFEQARYYKEMHEKLIHDAKILYNISYSDPENKNLEMLKNYLRDLWQNKTGITLKNINVRVFHTQYKNAPKRNPSGTLILKEYRDLTRLYYVRLLELLISKIKKEKNHKLALDFILGVLEGDGSPGPEKRGHIVIATNSEDSHVLGEVLGVTKIKSHIKKEGENKYAIHIGSLEIIKNISILKDKLFKYYPKRRKILKERLAKTGCARFLLGSGKTSNWLIGQLNKYGILDGKGDLTKFGESVKKDLYAFLKKERECCVIIQPYK